MGAIEYRFNQTFSTWGIRLPPEDVAARRRGKIVEAGWSIWYLFASDDIGDYLDCYASLADGRLACPHSLRWTGRELAHDLWLPDLL